MYETFDYEEPSLSPREDEEVGTGDGTTVAFNLEFRNVSVYSVYVDANLQTEGVDYSINTTTGVVTFTSAPALGVAITADYTHKFNVRFASPLQTEEISFQIYNSQAQLVEVF